MKIVYVIQNTWYAGGQTRVLVNKANYWVERGHDVYVITTDQATLPPYYPVDKRVHMIDLGISYLIFDQQPFLKKLLVLPKLFLRCRNRMQKVINEIQPDIVVSMFGKDIYVLPFVRTKAVKVLEAHGARYTWIYSRPGLRGIIQNSIDLWLARKFDQLVVLTHEDLPNWDLPHVVCIPNGNTFSPEESASLDAKVVIASGRYGVQKNFESLVEAWAIVHASHPDWRLKICGQELEKLDPTINRLNLQDSIDRIEASDMQKEYMESSISVVSSVHEGFSLALAEAASCGVPNVSYACPCGPRDIIVDGETGFLVERVGDHQQLAERINRLIEDEDLRKSMGRKAKERSVLFSVDSVMQRWTELFSSLIARKKKH